MLVWKLPVQVIMSKKKVTIENFSTRLWISCWQKAKLHIDISLTYHWSLRRWQVLQETFKLLTSFYSKIETHQKATFYSLTLLYDGTYVHCDLMSVSMATCISKSDHPHTCWHMHRRYCDRQITHMTSVNYSAKFDSTRCLFAIIGLYCFLCSAHSSPRRDLPLHVQRTVNNWSGPSPRDCLIRSALHAWGHFLLIDNRATTVLSMERRPAMWHTTRQMHSCSSFLGQRC